MRRSIRFAAISATVLTMGWALAQAPENHSFEKVDASAAPVAHIYVANATHVYAYSAAADGKLAPVPGSPFNDSLSWMAVNGHYLFGTEGQGTTIASFFMAANGALHKTATINTADYGTNDCSSSIAPSQFRIDHSGLTLYNAEILNENFCKTVFQSFKINDANGYLTFLGNTGTYLEGGADIGLLGNNQYAYAPECTFVDGNPYGAIVGYKRLTGGNLVDLSAGFPIPSSPPLPPQGNPPGFYCPMIVATDPTNHLAMTLRPLDQDGDEFSPAVIATYSADSEGNLITTSTYQNMAVLPMGSDGSCLNCDALRMSPSGKLLAAGGANGIELFHFNGGNPATKYKSILPGVGIGQIFWDNNNHLYAIGAAPQTSGQLYVFTVTPTSVTEAPGSPYSIDGPGSLTVQPL